jgi:hypothetical protein
MAASLAASSAMFVRSADLRPNSGRCYSRRRPAQMIEVGLAQNWASPEKER